MALTLTPELLAILAANVPVDSEQGKAIAAEKAKADAAAEQARIASERDADTKRIAAKLSARKDLATYLAAESALAQFRRDTAAREKLMVDAIVASRAAIEAADLDLVFVFNKPGDAYTVNSKEFAVKYPNAPTVNHRASNGNGTTHMALVGIVKDSGSNGVTNKVAKAALKQKCNLADGYNLSMRSELAAEIAAGIIVEVNGAYAFKG